MPWLGVVVQGEEVPLERVAVVLGQGRQMNHINGRFLLLVRLEHPERVAMR